jgi:hypothetical protein
MDWLLFIFVVVFSEAYKEVKKEKPPFLPNSDYNEVGLPEIPDDLKCSLCQDLLQDAVLIPCCGNSYCDECNHLLRNSFNNFLNNFSSVKNKYWDYK